MIGAFGWFTASEVSCKYNLLLFCKYCHKLFGWFTDVVTDTPTLLSTPFLHQCTCCLVISLFLDFIHRSYATITWAMPSVHVCLSGINTARAELQVQNKQLFLKLKHWDGEVLIPSELLTMSFAGYTIYQKCGRCIIDHTVIVFCLPIFQSVKEGDYNECGMMCISTCL